MNHPFVSTIIPTFNRSNIIGQAIESALAQDWPNHEVIVVDDGSTDDTECVCKKFGSLIVYVKQTNGGVSSARNRGIQLAQGEFIAFLDSDDLWMPRKLSLQMEQMLANSEIAVCSTHVAHVPPRTVSPDFAKTGAPWKNLFWRGDSWETSTIVTRKVLLRKIGGFREDITHYEDRDCWLRLLFFGTYCSVEQVLVFSRRMEGPYLSGQSTGHYEWVKSSRDILSVGRSYLEDEVVKQCYSFIKSQLPDMVYGCFWRGERNNAIKLGLLQIMSGPRKTMGIKYLIMTMFPLFIINKIKKVTMI